MHNRDSNAGQVVMKKFETALARCATTTREMPIVMINVEATNRLPRAIRQNLINDPDRL